MSIIYRALRKEKRAEAESKTVNAASLLNSEQFSGDEGVHSGEEERGLPRVWLEVLQARWSSFRGWFAEASPKTRAVMIAVPVLVVSMIGGLGFWAYQFYHGAADRMADQTTKPEAVAAKDAKQESAAKAADEALFSGTEAGAGEGASIPTEESPQEAVVGEDEAFSEEKLLAKFFGESAMPEVQEAKAAPGKEPPPLDVTPEEEEAALGKARLAKAKAKESESVVVSPDVQENREREVGRVVGDLRLAMGRGDAQQVEQMLVTLGQAKAGGEKDPFVLNMRAYWEISRGRYDQAAAILKQILERRPDDLEAGLNMAVVEMRTNRSTEAKARLFVLLQRYPGDSRPNEMLRYLR
ncbi:MAG: tetratricopeptide repeat protein [Magnetococcales bacterium]|nr:tetratricopeptide repeat protein [Magnetococcales bacterium]